MAKTIKKGKLDKIVLYSTVLMAWRTEVYLLEMDANGIWFTKEPPKKDVTATFIPYTNISHIEDIIDEVVEAVK